MTCCEHLPRSGVPLLSLDILLNEDGQPVVERIFVDGRQSIEVYESKLRLLRFVNF
jgi:hypothetical protein